MKTNNNNNSNNESSTATASSSIIVARHGIGEESPPTLRSMAIRSTDTLTGRDIPIAIPSSTWNEQPPLLPASAAVSSSSSSRRGGGGGGSEETTALLKGMLRHYGVPPALRCAIWISNVIQTCHPHHTPAHCHDYRTLAKVRVLDAAYESLIQSMSVDHNHSSSSSNSHTTNGWDVLPVPTFGRSVTAAGTAKPSGHTNHVATATTSTSTVIAGATAKGLCAWKRVLMALQSVLLPNNEEEEDDDGATIAAPMIPTLAALLLTVMSESYAFCVLREMFQCRAQSSSSSSSSQRSESSNSKGGDSSSYGDYGYYFPLSRREQRATVAAFQQVLKKLHKATFHYLDDLGVMDGQLTPIWQDFFVPLLPLHCVHRIMDLYTLEGIKVIHRVGVALLVLYKMYCADQPHHHHSSSSHNKIVMIRSAQEWWNGLHDWAHHVHARHFSIDTLIRKAYGVHGRGWNRALRFPRRHLIQRIVRIEDERLRKLQQQTQPQRQQQDKEAVLKNRSEGALVLSRPLGLVQTNNNNDNHPRFDSISADRRNGGDDSPAVPILAAETAARMHLARWLPLSLQISNLVLLYSTNTHGRSLEMLYRRCQTFRHTILLLEVLPPLSPPPPQRRFPSTNATAAATDDSKSKSGNDDPSSIVVGMYASQPWIASPHVYGNASCFLLRLSPSPACWKWNASQPVRLASAANQAAANSNNDDAIDDDGLSLDHDHELELQLLRTNNQIAILEQFMVGTPTYISMGGNPNGSAGLRLNDDLTIGESSTAAGFENEPLPGIDFGSSVFDIGLVEVYGLVRSIDGRPA